MFLFKKILAASLLAVTLSEKSISKGFERSVYWNEYKTKSRSKNMTIEYRYFLELNLLGVNRLFLLIYLNREDDAKRFKAQMCYLPKGVVKNYRIITNGKSFYDQPLDSYVKQFK